MNSASHPEPAAYTIAPVPYRSRVISGAAALAVGLAMAALLVGSDGDYWPVALAFLGVAYWVAWKLYMETEVKALSLDHGELTPAARIDAERVAELERGQEELRQRLASARMERTLRHPLFRYPMAGLVLWGAWSLGHEGHPAGLSLAGVAVAGIFAYELAILLIVIGVGYLLIQLAKALPVSIAIIVGATIIALAIRK